MSTHKVTCPCCFEEFRLELTIDARQLIPNENSGDWTEGLSDEDVRLVHKAQANGLIGALAEAVMAGPMRDHPPKSIERFLLTFLKTCKPKRIPPFALNKFKEMFPGKHIYFYSSNGVGAVTADRALELFVPIQVVSGEALAGTGFRLDAESAGLDGWVQGKHGYVPSEAKIALAELRKKSFGSFAKPLL